MEERHILDRTWVAACEPKRRRNELNDYSAAARRLFRKDRAFRSWMEEVRAPRQHALDAFDEFNAKRGPWQRLLRERRENRMVVVTTEAEASRAPEGRHQAGDLGDWGSAAALLYKNKVYRKWRAESPPDEATWEIFTEKRGPWDRRCRARRDRRRAQGGRDAREWRRRMLPCERAAIDSSRAAGCRSACRVWVATCVRADTEEIDQRRGGRAERDVGGSSILTTRPHLPSPWSSIRGFLGGRLRPKSPLRTTT